MSAKSNPSLIRKPQAAAILGVSTRQFDRLRKRYHISPAPFEHTGLKKPLFWWASVIESLAKGGYAWGDDYRNAVIQLSPLRERDRIALTTAQVAILDHTVHRAPRGFYCGGGSEMSVLVKHGLMELALRAAWCPDDYYRITPKGVAALNAAKEMASK